MQGIGLGGKAGVGGALLKLFRKGGPSVSREEALEARPMRNLSVKCSTGEEGEVTLEMDRRRDLSSRLLGLIVAAPLRKTVALDEMGSFVWNLCDGEHSVSEIASLLARKHKLNRREAILSLSTFLRDLGKRRLIGFAVSKEKQDVSTTT